MELKITQHDRAQGKLKTEKVDAQSAERIPLLKSGQIHLTRDGEPPTQVTHLEDGVKVVWADGFHIILVPADDGKMIPNVIINDKGHVPVDDYLTWMAMYSDSPLDFAPLPEEFLTLPTTRYFDYYDRLALFEEPEIPIEEEPGRPIPVRPTAISPETILPPIIEDEFAVTSEEGLQEGNQDSDGAGVEVDQTNSASVSGTMAVSDPQNLPLTITFGQPEPTMSSETGANTPFTSGGRPVEWIGVGTNNLMAVIDPQGDNIKVINITIDNLGNYTITVLRPLDNPYNTTDGLNDEDALIFKVPVSITNGATPPVIGTLTFEVEDDSPILLSPVALQSVDDEGITGGIEGGPDDLPGTSNTASANLNIA